jgi:DHA2 family multidrug resistance protein-like MFS transporter
VPFVAAEAARDTLGGALATAGELPAPLGAPLLGSARAAFGEAFVVVAIISAALLLATALMAGLMLRRVRPGGGIERQPSPVAEGAVAGGGER